MRAFVIDLQIESRVAGQRCEAAAKQLEKRLLPHFLVLRFDNRFAERERGARDANHHANDEAQQADGDHHLEQGEAAMLA